jgi:hypothetical protein
MRQVCSLAHAQVSARMRKLTPDPGGARYPSPLWFSLLRAGVWVGLSWEPPISAMWSPVARHRSFITAAPVSVTQRCYRVCCCATAS